MFDNLGKTIRFCPLLWKRMNNMVDYQYLLELENVQEKVMIYIMK